MTKICTAVSRNRKHPRKIRVNYAVDLRKKGSHRLDRGSAADPLIFNQKALCFLSPVDTSVASRA